MVRLWACSRCGTAKVGQRPDECDACGYSEPSHEHGPRVFQRVNDV